MSQPDDAASREFRAGGAGEAVAAEARQGWWLVLLLGAFSVFMGVVLLAWPDRTLLVLTVVLGIYLVVFGAIRFLVAIFDTRAEHRALDAVLGILGVVLGVFVMREPVRFVWVAAIVVGLFLLIRGLVDVFRSIARSDDPDRAWQFGSGVIALIAGAAILLWPDVSVLVLAVISGIYLIMSGVIEVVVAFKLRRG